MTRRGLAVVLFAALLPLMASCRDEDLDGIGSSSVTNGSRVEAPFFYVGAFTTLDDYDALLAAMPFEPLLPTYLPDDLEFWTGVAVPVQAPVDFGGAEWASVTLAFIGTGFVTLVESNSPAVPPAGAKGSGDRRYDRMDRR